MTKQEKRHQAMLRAFREVEKMTAKIEQPTVKQVTAVLQPPKLEVWAIRETKGAQCSIA